MTDYFQDYALKLLHNGYHPVPLRPGQKKPYTYTEKGDTTWQQPITEAIINDWLDPKTGAGTKANGGVGVHGACAIDSDVKDPVVARLLIKFIKANFKYKNLMLRVGMEPKFLIPVSLESAIPQKANNKWYDTNGIKQEIEFLSADMQYFMCYGIHPDTHKEFTWHYGNILETKAKDLPVFTADDLALINAEFNKHAKKRKWTRKDPSKSTGPGPMVKIKNQRAANNTTWFDDMIASGISEGGRVNGLLKAIGLMKRRDMSDDMIELIARGINDKCTPPLGEKELSGSVLKAIKKIVHEGGNLDIIDAFNSRFRYVEIGPKFNILEFKTTVDSFSGRTIITPEIKLPATLQTRYSNKQPVIVNKKPINQYDYWITHTDRAEAEAITFEPNEKPGEYTRHGKNYINLWTGLHVDPAEGLWPLFKKHIYEVICDKDAELMEWLMQWMAKLVQDPGGKRPGKVPVFRGGQGTGKGTFVNAIGRIFGLNHGYFTVGKAEHILKNFNDDMKTAVLIHIDEGTYGGKKDEAGQLKHLISEGSRRIEPKNVTPYHIKNHLNFFISSNMDWVVPSTRGERRFCIFDINEEYIQDENYFDALKHELNGGGLEAFLHYILNKTYTEAAIRDIPRTYGQRDQIMKSENNVIQFWYTCLYRGHIKADGDEWEEEITGEAFYNEYKEFVAEGKFRGDIDLQGTFGKKLNKYCPGYAVKSPVVNENGKTVSGKKLMSLDKNRELFEKNIFHGEIKKDYWAAKGEDLFEDEIPF